MWKRLIELIFKEKTNNLLIQLFRYGFVGGTAFLVDYGLLYILTSWGHLHYLLSASLSFVAGLVVNYLISTVWVFNDSRIRNKWTEFLVFSIIGVVGLGFTELLMWLFTDIIGFHYMISKLITAALVMLWNFFARRFVIFNK